MVALMIHTNCINRLLVRWVIRQMGHLTEKTSWPSKQLFWTVRFSSRAIEIFRFWKDQVAFSEPLLSVVENDKPRTQKTSPVPESSTPSSNQDFSAEFRTRSDRQVKAIERYGSPIDNSEDCSFVERFSCAEVPNSFEVFESESRDEWLAAMTKDFNSLVEKKTWQLCELPARKKPLSDRWVFALKKIESGESVTYNSVCCENFWSTFRQWLFRNICSQSKIVINS